MKPCVLLLIIEFASKSNACNNNDIVLNCFKMFYRGPQTHSDMVISNNSCACVYISYHGKLSFAALLLVY